MTTATPATTGPAIDPRQAIVDQIRALEAEHAARDPELAEAERQAAAALDVARAELMDAQERSSQASAERWASLRKRDSAIGDLVQELRDTAPREIGEFADALEQLVTLARRFGLEDVVRPAVLTAQRALPALRESALDEDEVLEQLDDLRTSIPTTGIAPASLAAIGFDGRTRP